MNPDPITATTTPECGHFHSWCEKVEAPLFTREYFICVGCRRMYRKTEWRLNYDHAVTVIMVLFGVRLGIFVLKEYFL